MGGGNSGIYVSLASSTREENVEKISLPGRLVRILRSSAFYTRMTARINYGEEKRAVLSISLSLPLPSYCRVDNTLLRLRCPLRSISIDRSRGIQLRIAEGTLARVEPRMQMTDDLRSALY